MGTVSSEIKTQLYIMTLWTWAGKGCSPVVTAVEEVSKFCLKLTSVEFSASPLVIAITRLAVLAALATWAKAACIQTHTTQVNSERGELYRSLDTIPWGLCQPLPLPWLPQDLPSAGLLHMIVHLHYNSLHVIVT